MGEPGGEVMRMLILGAAAVPPCPPFSISAQTAIVGLSVGP